MSERQWEVRIQASAQRELLNASELEEACFLRVALSPSISAISRTPVGKLLLEGRRPPFEVGSQGTRSVGSWAGGFKDCFSLPAEAKRSMNRTASRLANCLPTSRVCLPSGQQAVAEPRRCARSTRSHA